MKNILIIIGLLTPLFVFTQSNTVKNFPQGLILGTGYSGMDYTITIDGETYDGLLTYNEDNDTWTFNENVIIRTDSVVTFADTLTTIASQDDLHTQLHAMTSTSDHSSGNWKLFGSNGSGQVVEITNVGSGSTLRSQGTSALPTWEVPWTENEMFSNSTNAALVLIATGTSSGNYTTVSTGDHPGIFAITSHATNDGSGGAYHQMLSTVVTAGDEHRSTILIKDTTYSVLKIGFAFPSYTAATTTYGVYFIDTLGYKMRAVVNVNQVYSYAATTFTPALNTWYTFYVICTDAGHAQFIIKTDDGTSVYDQTITATLPTYNYLGGSCVIAYVVTQDAATQMILLDRIGYRSNRVLTRPY